MALILVERSFEQPTPFERLAAMERAVADCLARHRVQALRSFCARDQHHMVCLYEAPDAESVRTTQDEGGLPYDLVWPAQLVPCADTELQPGHAQVIVQRRMPGALDADAVRAVHAQSADCMRTYRVTPIESYLSADGTRTVCLFFATDAEAVRLASTQAGLPMERAWTAELRE